MKKIKSILISKLMVVAALSFIATACQQDEIIGMAKPMPQGEYISFNIQRGWDYDAISRSGDFEYGNHLSKHILVSEDKSESLEMSSYQQPIDTWFEKPASRGTMITSASFNEFRAFGYKTLKSTGATKKIFTTDHNKENNTDASEEDAGWEKPTDSKNPDGYEWPGADYTCSFFGIAMSDSKLTNKDFQNNVTTNTNDAGQIVSFDYTVPDAAVDQPDIMVAASGNVKGDGSEGATLNFKHILTAINIKVGTLTTSNENVTGVTIQSITFNNIYARGMYTIETRAWSNTVFYNEQKSFSIDFNGSGTGNGTYVNFEDNQGNTMNGQGATLMMIPQTLRNDATVTISYTLEGAGNGQATANIGGSIWNPGQAINYVLNIDNEDGIEFLTQDSYQDAHYVILPLNIKFQNEAGTLSNPQIRAIDVATGETADWVQFRNRLTGVENERWWADPSEIYSIDRDGNTTAITNNNPYARTNTLTITASGQCFAFLTENIGKTNRQVRFELYVTTNNAAQVMSSITVTQLCPTWENDNMGCERIEEGEILPWGYSWKRNEGESEYKVVLKTPGLLNSLWATLLNFLYGGVAEQYWNYFTFDYTSFVNGMANSETGAGSSTEGLQNTIYMYSYTGGGNMTGLYNYFRTNLGATIESSTFEGISYDEYATKEALKKNKVTVYIGNNAGNEEHNAIIIDTRTDLWYLPATEEVNILQNNVNMVSAETMMNNGDIFWTSTAAESPNAYSYTFGGNTQEEDRDNPHRIRAIRNISTTTTE